MRAPPAVQFASSPWCEQIAFNAVAFVAGASAFAEASADRRGPQRGSRVGVACRSLGGGWSASLAEARGELRRAEAGTRRARREILAISCSAASAVSALTVFLLARFRRGA